MNDTHKIVLIRHGLTAWTHRFTGWTDIDVLPEGLTQTKEYVPRLRDAGITFDICYTSVLKRAIKTALVVLDELDLLWIPHIKHWRMNERHYGVLQGMDKRDAVEKFGEDQVNIWRRGYDVPPPPLAIDDLTHPRFDPKYSGVNPAFLPSSESLEMVRERVQPFINEEILPAIMSNKRVLISGNHNAMRGLVMELKKMTPKEISTYNIPYSIPLVIEFNKNGNYTNDYYLASDIEVKEVIAKIKNQTKR